MKLPVNLIGLVLILAGVIWLQIFLSKKENKWLGLFLPLISLLGATGMTFSVIILESMSGWEVFTLLASAFLMGNIPTAVLLLIYFACREKTKRKQEFEKMNVQDLE